MRLNHVSMRLLSVAVAMLVNCAEQAAAGVEVEVFKADGVPTKGKDAKDAMAARTGAALVIGVDRYDHSPDGLYSCNDALELGRLLTGKGSLVRTVVVMTDKSEASLRPSGANIRRELAKLAKVSGGSVIVAFSGMAHNLRPVVRTRDAAAESAQGEQLHLIPADGSLVRKESMIPMSAVIEPMAKSTASFKLVLLDTVNPARTKWQVPEGIAVLAAASPGEHARCVPEFEHGIFSHYVFQALRGAADFDHDGLITLPELELYVKQRVPSYATSKAWKQMPWMTGSTYGLPPIIRLDWAESREKDDRNRDGTNRQERPTWPGSR